MLCDRAIVLDQGEVVCEGSPEDAVNHYNRIMAELDEHDQKMVKGANGSENYGTLSAEIVASELMGERSQSSVVASGERTRIELLVRANHAVDDVTVGILIRDRFGQDIFGTNSFHLGNVMALSEGEERTVAFSLPMDIAPGKYTVTAALHSQENHIDDCYHWCDNLLRFEVAGVLGASFSGACRLHPTLEINSQTLAKVANLNE